ncbi:hypothetical protein BSKO_12966 [Bryopsis sp. KO-2023]|nr:hypothetical protein BSKO_12966 [Bryopsis sp. KO-2023]
MEDAHLVVFDQACSEGSPTMDAVVGIFDGHGGCQSSAFVADNFSRFLAEQEDCSHEEAIRGAFARCDTELWRRFDDDGSTLDASGTTALVAAVVDQKMLVANLGDSRAVLCTNGRAQQVWFVKSCNLVKKIPPQKILYV